jgi:hypothetical protein
MHRDGSREVMIDILVSIDVYQISTDTEFLRVGMLEMT